MLKLQQLEQQLQAKESKPLPAPEPPTAAPKQTEKSNMEIMLEQALNRMSNLEEQMKQNAEMATKKALVEQTPQENAKVCQKRHSADNNGSDGGEGGSPHDMDDKEDEDDDESEEEEQTITTPSGVCVT